MKRVLVISWQWAKATIRAIEPLLRRLPVDVNVLEIDPLSVAAKNVSGATCSNVTRKPMNHSDRVVGAATSEHPPTGGSTHPG